MINVTEKLGIDYTPILINIPCNDHFGIISQPDMMNIILAASESVTDTIFKCHLRLNTDHIDTNEKIISDDNLSEINLETIEKSAESIKSVEPAVVTEK